MKRGVIIGTLLWLGVTTIALIWSDVLLPSSTQEFARAFLFCGPVSLCAGLLLRFLACPEGEEVQFGVGVTLPGMFLGASTMLLFGQLFPDLTPFTRGHYGALILWSNGIILSVIALSAPKPPHREGKA